MAVIAYTNNCSPFIHKLLSNLKEMQMAEAFPINHVALVLDTMDIDNAEDLELTEEESKQRFGSAVSRHF